MTLGFQPCTKSFPLAESGQETEKSTNIVYMNVPFNLYRADLNLFNYMI